MKAAALVVLVLAVAARTRLTGTVLGLPVSVPAIGLVAIVLALILLVVLLYLALRFAATIAECIRLRMVAT